MADNKYLADLLVENKSKNFVDRIINREKYSSIDLGGGRRGTHLMAWATVEGKPLAYPTIIYENGNLVRYRPNDALKKALSTGEYIEFKEPLEADWFSKNYKLFWDKQ